MNKGDFVSLINRKIRNLIFESIYIVIFIIVAFVMWQKSNIVSYASIAKYFGENTNTGKINLALKEDINYESLTDKNSSEKEKVVLILSNINTKSSNYKLLVNVNNKKDEIIKNIYFVYSNKYYSLDELYDEKTNTYILDSSKINSNEELRYEMYIWINKEALKEDISNLNIGFKVEKI